MNRPIKTTSAGWIANAVVLLSLGGSVAIAQTNARNYAVILGSGFLCDPSDASICPTTTKSAQGDTYVMSGAGAFDPQNKSVKSAGIFSHKSANGDVVETGVWIATELVSFVSYGVAPTALLRETRGLNPLQTIRMPSKMPSGPMPTGGLTVFRVRLLPLSGSVKMGVLQVNCALGHVPQERSVEGIRLSFDGDPNEFSQEVAGRVMFLSIRPETSPTVKALENTGESDSAPGQLPR